MTHDREITALTATRRMSHGAQLARAARLFPRKVAFQCGDDQRTYAELDERVTRLARALAARGVARGDRVAVFMQNSLELVEAYPYQASVAYHPLPDYASH